MATSDPAATGLKILPPGGPTGTAAPSQTGQPSARTAEDFEAMVLSELISAMFSTQQQGIFSPGQAGDIYRSLLTQEYGKAFAKAGGIGIAHELQREIIKLQEVSKR